MEASEFPPPQPIQAYFQLALAAANIGIWDWNLQTRQIADLACLESILGLSPGSFDGREETFWACVDPDDREALKLALDRAFQQHQDFYHQFRIIWPDGSRRWIESRGQFIDDAIANSVRMLGTIVDISDRKQAEFTSKQANAELEMRLIERAAELSRTNSQLQQELRERQQIEEALRTSQARFAGILDIAEDAIISINANQCITLFNRGAEKIFGYTAEEAIGQPLDLLLPQQFTTSHRQHVKDFAQSSDTARQMGKRGQIFGRRRDGSQFPAEASISQLILAGETIFTVFLRDISDRQRSEEELSRLAAIIESSDDAIIGKTLDGVIVSWNAGAQRIFGYTASEAIGQSAIILNPPDQSDEELQILQKIAHSERIEHYETLRVKKNGQQIPISLSVSPIKDKMGKIIGASTIARDISLQKQVAAMLLESERRWRRFLESVRLLVIGLDLIGTVEYVNPFFLEFSGYTKAEIVGTNWFEHFVPRLQQQGVRQYFLTGLTAEFQTHYQYSILIKSGEERLVAWNHTFLQNSQGEAIGTLSIGEDITEQYAVERMKNEFISVVSHELRTPLTSIHGALNLLATGLIDPLSERGKRAIAIAADSADRLVRLVNDILELERLESGKIRLTKQHCNAVKLMQQAAEQIQVMAHRAGVHLNIREVEIGFQADPDRIIQVLTNLLSNAIKFSDANSTVTLTVQQQSDRAIQFEVTDQGRGIPPDKLEQIFERFHQVDASDSRKKGGTGLGLAICRSIIEQHGGKIWAESLLGRGTSFYFVLPQSSHLI